MLLIPIKIYNNLYFLASEYISLFNIFHKKKIEQGRAVKYKIMFKIIKIVNVYGIKEISSIGIYVLLLFLIKNEYII